MHSEQGLQPSDYIGCNIVDKEHPDYEEVRALYNGMIDKSPNWIVQCETKDHVSKAVRFVDEHSVLLAVRSGGHNGPGLGSCDDGMVIDLSKMNDIAIDAENRTVRVQPGCTQGDVDRAMHPHGLAVPAGIVSTTGIAGLTLGGGHGYLSRAYGLTIDSLIEAEVVLADGSSVTASKTENADLFWALRGGGGNFGIVVSFLFQAHPVSSVYGGPIFWDVAHAPEIMRWYRDFLPTAREELCVFLGMKRVPSCDPFPQDIWGRRICAFISCYNGPQVEGEAAFDEILKALPEPIMDGMSQMDFVDLQALFDPLLPKGLQWYWKGDYVDDLCDESIDIHMKYGGNAPCELSLMHLYPIDGAVHSVDADATAWGARNSQWSMVIAGISPDPAKADDLKQWASDYWGELHQLNQHGGAYVNFMMDDEGDARVRAAYGKNYERLLGVKRKYDPENLFRVNQNIDPKARSA